MSSANGKANGHGGGRFGFGRILVDPGKPVPFQPRGEEGPTYFLRVPTAEDRADWRALLDEHRARRHSVYSLVEAAKDCIKELLADEEPDREAMLAELDAYRDGIDEAAKAARDGQQGADDELRSALDGTPVVQDILEQLNDFPGDRDEWPRSVQIYRKRRAENESFYDRRGKAAASAFLVGWEGIDAEFKKRGAFSTVPTKETLAKIPANDLASIGGRIDELINLTEDRVGNSSSRSSRPSSPKRSGGSKSSTPTETPSPTKTDSPSAGSEG
jgi:hypothetical protein